MPEPGLEPRCFDSFFVLYPDVLYNELQSEIPSVVMEFVFISVLFCLLCIFPRVVISGIL